METNSWTSLSTSLCGSNRIPTDCVTSSRELLALSLLKLDPLRVLLVPEDDYRCSKSRESKNHLIISIAICEERRRMRLLELVEFRTHFSICG